MRTEAFTTDTKVAADEKEAMQMLRAVFFNEYGLKALHWILMHCRYYEKLRNEDDVSRHNLAVELLEAMGVYQPQNIPQLMGSLMETVPYVVTPEMKEKADGRN